MRSWRVAVVGSAFSGGIIFDGNNGLDGVMGAEGVVFATKTEGLPMVARTSDLRPRAHKTALVPRSFPLANLIHSPPTSLPPPSPIHLQFPQSMTNPTLIVTGASRGIGRSITLLAIQNLGANVIAVARSQEALQELSRHIETDLQLKDRFKFVAGDVTAETTVTEAIALAAKSWSGRLDGLVLNAG